MAPLVEIPICDQAGTSSGASVHVKDPPPATVRRLRSTLELRRFRRLKRFGCGCYWEEELGYVRRRPAAS